MSEQVWDAEARRSDAAPLRLPGFVVGLSYFGGMP